MLEKFLSASPEETENIAFRFAKSLNKPTVIAFLGDLGMGKTCFTRGLAKGLDYNGDVTSPTFALVNEYKGGRFPIFHFDMYRIDSFDDLYSTGFFDYLDEDGIIVIEWSENISSVLEKDTVYVKIDRISDTEREITIFDKDGADS